MIRPQPRAVEGELVGCGVAHFNGGVKRTVVDVGAEIPKYVGQVEPVVIYRDHRRGSTIAVLKVQVCSSLNQPPDGILISVSRGPHKSSETARGIVRILAFG